MENTNPHPDPHPETPLEKIMKEKFGSADFSGLMASIVDKMLDSMNAHDKTPKKDA